MQIFESQRITDINPIVLVGFDLARILLKEIVYKWVQSGTRVRAYTRTRVRQILCLLRLTLSTTEDWVGKYRLLLPFPNLNENIRPINNDSLIMFFRLIFWYRYNYFVTFRIIDKGDSIHSLTKLQGYIKVHKFVNYACKYWTVWA